MIESLAEGLARSQALICRSSPGGSRQQYTLLW
jgi:hypothetical protein